VRLPGSRSASTRRRRIRSAATGAALALATALSVASCTAGPAPSPPPDDRLHRDIAGFVDGYPYRQNPIRAVVVRSGDRIVAEDYFDSTPEESRSVYGVTATVASTLVGIAADEGLLDPRQTLAELLPAYAPIMRPEVAGTTLEQVLTMTGGFPESSSAGAAAVWASSDWTAAALDSADSPPGQRFAYSAPAAHLLGAILVQATGESVLDYARERLLTPLGIDTGGAMEEQALPANQDDYDAAAFAWPVDPQGIHLTESLLKLRPRDLAALGALFLHDGEQDGTRILSSSWVRRATSSRVAAQGVADGFGYLWWVRTVGGDPAYLSWGEGGQLLEVIPDRDLVVVVSSEHTDPTLPPSYIQTLVESVILPRLPR
jgi:CubicO group peptidase (beta-lactamase class C family)